MLERSGYSSLLERASSEWRSSLIDVGGNNRLLYFKPSASTLNLTSASAASISRLLAGEELTLNELFSGANEIEAARKACASLSRKQKEALEEFGVPIAFLASGVASWDPEGTKQLAEAFDGEAQTAEETKPSKPAKPKYTRPSAPVLLRPVEITRKRGAQDNWTVKLNDDFQLNSVLQHVMNADNNRLVADEIQELDEGTAQSMEDMLTSVEQACSDVAEFAIDRGFFLGAFSYQKQPMVADIENLEALAESELIAALAGEPDAVENVRAIAVEIEDSQPDYAPVDSEYLVLDADASQSYVVNAAVAGRNLVVEGPPGTGKSQTIANVIAALVADGKHVLFVAQKRAAVSAVLDRLTGVGLDALVLDAFASTSSRRFVAEELRRAIDSQRQTGVPNVSNLHFELEAARDRLVGHKDALFKPEHGWGISVSGLRAMSLAIAEPNRVELRLPESTYTDWSDTDLERYAVLADELAQIGAFEPDWFSGPGWNPVVLQSNEILQSANNALNKLQSVLLPSALKLLSEVNKSIGADLPKTWTELKEYLERQDKVNSVAQTAPSLLSPTENLASVSTMLAAIDRRFKKEQGIQLSWGEKRSARRRVQSLLPGVDARQIREVLRTCVLLWENPIGDSIPVPPESYSTLVTAFEALWDSIVELEELTVGMPLSEVALADLKTQLGILASQTQRSRMPRAFELEQVLIAGGQAPIIDFIRENQSAKAASNTNAGQIIKWVAINSLLEDAQFKSPELAGIDGKQLEEAVQKYQAADVEHLEANAARIRRIFAESLKATLDSYSQQHQILKTEVTRKRNFRTIRNLIAEAPDVMLAAKPVWAMSPLQVSKLLPPKAIFDVVIFDEASQIIPADAIPAILRGNQVIVAGDSRQLPPTQFFSKVLEDSGTNDSNEIELLAEDESVSLDAVSPVVQKRSSRTDSFTRDAESILFAMDRVLAGQSRRLLWHYRSKDERLIAVSNAHVYDSSLTTFPAADAKGAINYVSVPPSKGIQGKTNSPEKEVEEVVSLVKEHYSNFPDESLGVITFGSPHQRRIELALDKASQQDKGLAEWLTKASSEPFFVKNIERVQGDERDAIILTVGYGKEPNGKLKYFWGPLLREGGERRLNVAISRAKKRMTLITSFTPDDVPEDGHDSAGFRLMYRFIRFMASGGDDLYGGADTSWPLNPFEIDVRDRLSAAGLKLDPQVGVGSYRIDFAVRHPKLPGKYVLAVEADGASYHSGHTARERDRLRQSLLEKRGWVFHRIWSTDWFNDAEGEIEKVLASYKSALQSKPSSGKTQGISVSQETQTSWNVEESVRTVPMPRFTAGLAITEYPVWLLKDIIRSIRSDNVLRTHDEELEIVMSLLGMKKKGARIVRVISSVQLALGED